MWCLLAKMLVFSFYHWIDLQVGDLANEPRYLVPCGFSDEENKAIISSAGCGS